jgi:hypothetical protein
MGLDISSQNHEAYWTYDDFHRFRSTLAKHMALRDYATVDTWPEEYWAKLAGHPLYPLLRHSDCDGVLTPQECRAMAGPLFHMITRIWQPEDYHWDAGIDFVHCLIDAVKYQEDVEFH